MCTFLHSRRVSVLKRRTGRRKRAGELDFNYFLCLLYNIHLSPIDFHSEKEKPFFSCALEIIKNLRKSSSVFLHSTNWQQHLFRFLFWCLTWKAKSIFRHCFFLPWEFCCRVCFWKCKRLLLPCLCSVSQRRRRKDSHKKKNCLRTSFQDFPQTAHEYNRVPPKCNENG